MSDLERRRGGYVSRSTRRERAYRLVLLSGGLSVAAAVALVLAIAGVTGAGWFILLAVAAAACWLVLGRQLSSRR